jgi:hypothetical protein
MFETVREKYLSNWTNIEWVSEVNIGVGGSVDFVAITKNRKGEIIDFLCVIGILRLIVCVESLYSTITTRQSNLPPTPPKNQ